MNFDISRMKRSDQVIAVCGVLLFLSLFLPFFRFSIDSVTIGSEHIGGGSHNFAGHSSGFFAWAGLWLGFLAGGLGFFAALGLPWPAQLPVTKTLATLGVSALATVCLVLKLLIGFHGIGRSFGLFFALVAVIVQVVFAVLAFKESGEALPTKADFQGLTDNFTGGGGSAPSYQPPPAPGYAPPSFGTPPPPAGFAAPPSFGTPPPPAEPPASWQQPPSE